MSWDFDAVERSLAEWVGRGDPEDPRERTRRRILAAATEHFVRHGYRKASVDDIARQAGVAKGTVYLHFKSKADLLLHAVALEKSRYLERMRPVFDAALPPRERLRTFLDLAFGLAGEMPLVSRLTRGDADFQHVLADLDPGIRARMEEDQVGFARWILDPIAAERGWSEADLADRARMLVGLLGGVSALVGNAGRLGLSAARSAALFAESLVEGLAPSRKDPE